MPSRRIAAVAVAALLMVPASALGARTAYVADGDGVTAQLMVGVGGALTPLGAPALTAESPRRLTMTPDGTSLYVTAGPYWHGRVFQYDVATDGAATPKATPAVAAGKKPVAIAIDPAGETVYVADSGSRDLHQFHVGEGGALEPLDELELHGPPVGLTVAPDGKRVYLTVGGFIKWMSVSEGGGLDPSTLAGLARPAYFTDVVLTPDGRHLYASTYHDGILGFAVADDGSLTELDPSATETGAKVTALAISADGGSLYAAAKGGDSGGARLLQYAIEESGALTSRDPASLPLGSRPYDLAITPDGRSLYVAAGDLALFDLDEGGLASPKTPAAVDLFKANGVVVSPNQAPVAHFEAMVAPAGSAVSFDAGGATDSDGSITRYDWDFGDGNTLANGGPQVSHVYAQPGTYEVRLVVTDNEGASTLTTFNGNSVLGNGSPAATTSRVIQVAAAALPLAPPIVPAQPARPELGETRDRRARRRPRARAPAGRGQLRGPPHPARDPRGLARRRAPWQGAAEQHPRPWRERSAGALLARSVPGAPAALGALHHRACAARRDRALPARNARERGGASLAAPLGQRQGPLPDPRALLVGSGAGHALARGRHLRGDADGGAPRARGGARLHA